MDFFFHYYSKTCFLMLWSVKCSTLLLQNQCFEIPQSYNRVLKQQHYRSGTSSVGHLTGVWEAV